MSFFLSLVKGFLTTVGIFLIVTGVGIVLVKPQAEEALRRSMQDELSDAVGAPVFIEATRVSLLRRAIRLQTVTISNPAAFREEPAFTCREVIVKLSPLSLLTGSPQIDLLAVNEAIVNYRYKAGTGTNIGMLVEALDEYSATNPNARRYRLNLLDVRGAKVNFSTNLIPVGKLGIQVVNVRRENIDPSTRMSNGQVVRIVLLSIIKEAVTLNGLTEPLIRELKEIFE